MDAGRPHWLPAALTHTKREKKKKKQIEEEAWSFVLCGRISLLYISTAGFDSAVKIKISGEVRAIHLFDDVSSTN